MKAYDLVMVLIFINCGFAVVIAMAPQLDIIPGSTEGYNTLMTLFTAEWFSVFGIGVNTMTALALLFAAGTIVVLNSNPVTDKGLSMTTFTAVFWGNLIITSAIFGTILTKYDVNLGIFYTIFFIAATLIFINALIQISSGGQQSHV
jgi:hypothetical protein